MKLYIEDGEIFLDYSDVDFNDRMAGDHDYRFFTHEGSDCGWVDTLKPKIKRAHIKDEEYLTPYGNACRRRFKVSNIYNSARFFNSIEIVNESDFKNLLLELDEECERLGKIEQEKERKRKAEQEWNSLCKYGCGSCRNKRRCGDDFRCAATGDYLDEKNCPGFDGRVYQLFNYQPFPTDNCPFNINKIEEAV